jgi:hypothetical protein
MTYQTINPFDGKLVKSFDAISGHCQVNQEWRPEGSWTRLVEWH